MPRSRIALSTESSPRIRCSSRRSRDIVGLYLDPPERAMVLCVDEKSQIQALDRSAPKLSILSGTPARAPHVFTCTSRQRARADQPRRALVRRADHPQATPRGASHVTELNADIEDWVEHWNENPKPYVWTKTADEILDNLTRYCNTINASRH